MYIDLAHLTPMARTSESHPDFLKISFSCCSRQPRRKMAARPRVITSRRGKVLINENYLYSANQHRANSIYWKCRHLGCTSRLTTYVFQLDDSDAVIHIRNHTTHNHLPQDERCNRIASVSEMRNRILADPSQPVRRVYDQVATVQHQAAAAAANQQAVLGGAAVALPPHPAPVMPQFHTVRSGLNRVRASAVPPVPVTLNDVLLPPEWSQTWQGDLYLLHQVCIL